MDEITVKLARWLNANKTGFVFIWFGDEKRSSLAQRKFFNACRRYKKLAVRKSGYVQRTDTDEKTTVAYIGDPNSAYFMDNPKFKFYLSPKMAEERSGLMDYLRSQGKEVEVIIHD